MRIIGGTHRGRTIKMPGKNARPTQDRVREAIFNVIRDRVPESAVLDLYAASGAFGLEALSRGALSCVFVDNNSKCIKTTKSNISSLGYSSEFTQLFRKDALKSIDAFAKEARSFDIIFMDPPYYEDRAKNCLIKIGACDILAPHGFVVAEHSTNDLMPEKTGVLTLFKQKRYGDTRVSFYLGGT